jgi:putative component of membrane protein insertase Oxa1/YidC/SpoIIIJ protein YidD
LIVRWQKNQDYRVIRIYRDLVGDWIVEQCWGNATSSHQCRTLVESREAARAMLLQINREQRRLGFRRSTPGEEQLAFGFEFA